MKEIARNANNVSAIQSGKEMVRTSKGKGIRFQINLQLLRWTRRAYTRVKLLDNDLEN